jgi:hypothetical protein
VLKNRVVEKPENEGNSCDFHRSVSFPTAISTEYVENNIIIDNIKGRFPHFNRPY